ncbi:MAG TPA: ABC transporter, partial [Methanocorpusculum sp.]|nr:ABC transporter [Methanocorpusculum sp.]
ACVFAKDSDLLILDEPYASLDSSAKDVLTTLIENRRGITIVFSHEVEYVPSGLRWKVAAGVLHRE